MTMTATDFVKMSSMQHHLLERFGVKRVAALDPWKLTALVNLTHDHMLEFAAAPNEATRAYVTVFLMESFIGILECRTEADLQKFKVEMIEKHLKQLSK